MQRAAEPKQTSPSRRPNGIPKRFQSCTLNNWTAHGSHQKEIFATLVNYIDGLQVNASQGAGLTLLGPTGTGKTHLLSALIAAACGAGLDGQYWAWPNLVQSAKAGEFALDEDPRAGLFTRVASLDVLALDNMEQVTGYPWERTQLFELLDSRYREQRPTLLAAGLSISEFRMLLGSELSGRIKEVNRLLWVAGASWRER